MMSFAQALAARFRLGGPDWLHPDSADATHYGHHTGNVGRATKKAVRSIKIVGEDMKSKSVLDDAAAALRRAKYVYFLGFGFDERNLPRISVPDSTAKAVVRATAFGWSSAEVSAIKPLFGLFRVDLYDLDVISFLRERAEALFE